VYDNDEYVKQSGSIPSQLRQVWIQLAYLLLPRKYLLGDDLLLVETSCLQGIGFPCVRTLRASTCMIHLFSTGRRQVCPVGATAVQVQVHDQQLCTMELQEVRKPCSLHISAARYAMYGCGAAVTLWDAAQEDKLRLLHSCITV
jgi:hypothetical protein